jgi:hypothetical protein
VFATAVMISHYNLVECQYMNAPYAKPSIRSDLTVKIAPVHSDSWCDFWSRSLMGFAGWLPIAFAHFDVL